MPISEKAQRAWKAGTAVVTAFTAFYSVFCIDYGPGPHVFTGLQSWYRQKIDSILGVDLEATRKRQISDNNAQKNIYGGRGEGTTVEERNDDSNPGGR
mmetsp:Transcript_5934/g.12983  ORF Transcript_5934/g.12983 Transcript_5934/m.12983 type:complete len:98 (+) Transcript_5934:27-320(+)